MADAPFSVGQTIYYARVKQYPRGEIDLIPEVITAIGRKWATIGRAGRFDMQTRMVDGGGYSSPGRIYLSVEEYETRVANAKAWAALERAIRYKSLPPGISAEAIERAAELLGVKLDV